MCGKQQGGLRRAYRWRGIEPKIINVMEMFFGVILIAGSLLGIFMYAEYNNAKGSKEEKLSAMWKWLGRIVIKLLLAFLALIGIGLIRALAKIAADAWF